jgi:hypothetical protein
MSATSLLDGFFQDKTLSVENLIPIETCKKEYEILLRGYDAWFFFKIRMYLIFKFSSKFSV